MSKIKSGTLRYNSSVIFEIIKNDPIRKELSFIRHQVILRGGTPEIEHYELLNLDYHYLAIESSFRNSVELDKDGMHGYIIGIFER
jgi:hypothetical protein